MTNEKNQENGNGGKPRIYVSQADVPAYSLEQAVRIPRAIAENYALAPVTPLQLAAALDMSPTSGGFRGLCGAAQAYVLTSGGYNAKLIELTSLGKRCVKPLEERDDIAALREAFLKPRIVGEFLRKYDGASLPRPDIAENVLQAMGVPAEKAASVFEMIVDGARRNGFVREIKGKDYVQLDGVVVDTTDQATEPAGQDFQRSFENHQTPVLAEHRIVAGPTLRDTGKHRRVFVTHGRNKELIDPIKKLLGFGEMTPVVSIERESVSKPVPDKVMDDMRSCGAAIIHVADESRIVDKEMNEHIVINGNVLMEIGAAMALYGRRFILLVKEGVQLPSNLQGLYEVRYRGESLDGEATIKLLEAINDIKNHELPKTEAVRSQPLAASA